MNDLLIDIRDLILAARKTIVRSVDLIQVLTNFEIGRRLVEHEQQGKERAEYGSALLKALSVELTAEFGRGFSRSNLEYMRKFFLTYQERAARISQMASGKSGLPLKEPKTLPVNATNPQDSQIALGKLVSPFKLGWSQYVFLIAIDNPDERSFYEIESANNGWTLPELKRQFNASLYERLALSRDQQGIARPEDLLKEPYSLGGNHLAQRRQYPCAEIFALFAGQGIAATEIDGVGRKY
ncbi:DUF1016 N-terminal domain-containing protein [Methylicorpusculum sp.]|uniref:DUF1016 N-terminal domain-containing protein n=1 Tax=Methylicorpusculum sp. TaxID=2713644 RepID=UPI00272934D3|nr:DUF1016 N-terminal domain-containing protein [Methylicorpusculum sp.]MDO8845446.1 DUF1016 N-terminal domain-containing protein [Methylicorpusculum sp.]